MYAVIMAGGSGTRLWPLSRKNKPKQFHSFVGDKSLVQETYDRLLSKFKPKNIIISTVKEYADEIKRHLPDIPDENYIIEPALMGNAAACGLVTSILNAKDPESSVIFLPADHMIKDTKRFIDTIDFAEEMINEYPENIVTIGINPTKPDTGLGYIQMDSQILKKDSFTAFSVKRFVEKPNQEKAEEYVASWDYQWNSGIFTWKTKTMLSMMKKFMPETFEHLQNIIKALGTEKEKQVLESEYKKVEKTSIDYGIMEKTNKIMVIPGDFGWSDIGSWGSLLEFFTDMHGAKVITKGHHVGAENENCLVLANDKLVATYGLKNIIIVDSPDALLICDRDKSAEIKNLLDKIKDEGKHLYL